MIKCREESSGSVVGYKKKLSCLRINALGLITLSLQVGFSASVADVGRRSAR